MHFTMGTASTGSSQIELENNTDLGASRLKQPLPTSFVFSASKLCSSVGSHYTFHIFQETLMVVKSYGVWGMVVGRLTQVIEVKRKIASWMSP